MYKYLVGSMLLVLSVSANADTVKLKYVSGADTVSTKVKVGSSTVTGLFGSYNIQEKGSNAFLAFCVDPYQHASSSYYDYKKSDLDASDFINNGAARLLNVQKLFDNAYSTLGGDDIQTAGFHLALWEVFHEKSSNSIDIYKGHIQDVDGTWWSSGTNSHVLKAADSFLDSLGQWKVKGLYDLTFYENGHKQDYIGFTPVMPVSPVPVPAALPLLMSGLVGLGFMRRRKSA